MPTAHQPRLNDWTTAGSKNSKKMPEWEKGDGDDSASCASTGTMLSSLALGEDDEDFYEDDPLQQGLDDLFEKR
jgi:hypothetical protein